MSLMRLLSVGRSLARASDAPTRYRILRRGLPKFGLAEKPGAVRGTRAVEQSSTKTKPMKQTEAQPRIPSAPASGQEPAHRFPLGRWGFFRNPFGNATPAPKQTPAVEPLAPVQGELSLETVRPVRNDLTDSDVMVIRSPKVPVQSGVAAASPLPAGPGARRELEGATVQGREPVWSRLKSQLFGAGNA